MDGWYLSSNLNPFNIDFEIQGLIAQNFELMRQVNRLIYENEKLGGKI